MSVAAVTATIEELTVEEGRALVDALAHDRLGIGREEFLRRLDSGDYDHDEHEDVVRLKMLAPFAR